MPRPGAAEFGVVRRMMLVEPVTFSRLRNGCSGSHEGQLRDHPLCYIPPMDAYRVGDSGRRWALNAAILGVLAVGDVGCLVPSGCPDMYYFSTLSATFDSPLGEGTYLLKFNFGPNGREQTCEWVIGAPAGVVTQISSSCELIPTVTTSGVVDGFRLPDSTTIDPRTTTQLTIKIERGRVVLADGTFPVSQEKQYPNGEDCAADVDAVVRISIRK